MAVQFDDTKIVAAEIEAVRDKVPTLFDRDDNSMFYPTIEKRDVEMISNRDARGPLEVRPGGNFAAFNPEGGSLGKGSGPVFDKWTLGSSYLKIGFEWTKKAQWGTDTSRKAVKSAVKHLLAISISEFRRMVEALMVGDGTGVLATITSINTAGGKDTYTCTTDGFGVRRLRFNEFVRIVDTGLTTVRAMTPAGDGEQDTSDTNGANSINIDLWDVAAKQVRIGGAATGVIAGDKIILNNLAIPSPATILGAKYHHSDASTGTWMGLNRANFPEIRCNRVNAASGSFALVHARLAVNKIADRMGTGAFNDSLEAWMHMAQKQAYEDIGQTNSIIQKLAKEENLNMYFDEMQMAGARVRINPFWDKTRIDFINRSKWGRVETHAAGFYEEDGKRLFELRDANGYVKTASIFYLAAGFNVFNENPGSESYVDTLAVPTGY